MNMPLLGGGGGIKLVSHGVEELNLVPFAVKCLLLSGIL